jgi:hypothetical protein
MSLGQNIIFESELENALQEAGFSADPIGRKYRFGCEHGSHHHILVGTILSVEVSDEGGLDLYVTNPRFWGQRLISIKHNDGRWMAYVDIPPLELSDADLQRMSGEERDRAIEESVASRFFGGELRLL